jgi:GTPase SAR1 family protein
MNFLDSLFPIIAALLGAVASAIGTWLFAAARMPTSYRVAIIGFPRSGKTTLITSVFDYLFRHGARGGSVVPRGDETIKRINDNLEQLELYRAIKPTTDQDIFAYRAEVIARRGRFRRRYKLEIGDFPGEDTVAFTEKYGEWLHDTPYFQWASSADAFVFVIDTGRVMVDESGEYVARQKSAFRAAWQRLQEIHLDGTTNLSAKPLLLVFAKADLLLHQLAGPQDIEELASGELLPLPGLVSEEEIDKAARRVTWRFDDLSDYLSREARRFDVILTSVVTTVETMNAERLGIPDLASKILPRPTFRPFPLRADRDEVV